MPSLCILTPDIGASIATFIRRHAVELLPHGTAVAGFGPHADVPLDWRPAGPSLDLSRVGGGGSIGRLQRAAGSRLGLRLDQRALARFLRRNRVEAVMGEYLDFAIPWLDTVKNAGCRFYAHAHGHDVSGRLTQPDWRRDYQRYSESDGVITINEPSRQALVALGIPANKVHVVHYGVEVADKPPARARSSADRVMCVAVGRMVPQKAPILLLDSFRRAFERHPQLHLHYIGGGPLLPAVEQFVQAFALHDAVTIDSWKSNAEVRALMRGADLFLQHSRTDPHTGDQEGLPLAILEAMAEGVPVVSTVHAGIPEAVLEGETGFLVTEGDSEAMANRILTLAVDESMRRRFSAAAYERARSCFTWTRERNELLRVLGLSSAA
jgi:colanic acid/amylovoran biosynthesis glycosyltransferase